VNRHRVLIIDDEPGVRRTLERALRGHHYEVVSVGDTNSAYQVLGETSFDVVLLDLRLPQISGDAFFLAIVRQWPRLLGRVILMSGDPLPPSPDWPASTESSKDTVEPEPYWRIQPVDVPSNWKPPTP